MSNEASNLLIKQIYRQGLRRLFIINFTNNIILFSIVGVAIFDFSILINSANMQSSSNLLLILLLMIPILSLIKSYKELPGIYLILATIDHHAGTRGTFSLLHELSKKEPENGNLNLLIDKADTLIKNISMKKIFPWKLLWNGYFGAALAFTAILWVALPHHKKAENVVVEPELTAIEKDITVNKDDPMLSAFRNNLPPPSEKDSAVLNPQDKKTVSQKSNKENTVVNTQSNIEKSNVSNNNKDEPKKDIDPQETAKKNKGGGDGSGLEEAHSELTTQIKKNDSTLTSNGQKINLSESNKQDGSSDRNGTLGDLSQTLTQEQLNSSATIKMQKINHLSDMVSSQYKKVIENYFREED